MQEEQRLAIPTWSVKVPEPMWHKLLAQLIPMVDTHQLLTMLQQLPKAVLKKFLLYRRREDVADQWREFDPGRRTGAYRRRR